MLRRILSWRILLGTILGLYLGWHSADMIASAQGRTDPLVGTWKIDLIPEDQIHQKIIKDSITFKVDDTFISEAFKKKGFPDGKVETDARPFGPAKFTVIIESKSLGKLKWIGSATGGSIEGAVAWTEKDGNVLHYTFHGERKS